MQHQLRLKDSPIAMESRYQLWKMNPQHPWLHEHSNDVQRWNRGAYYRTHDASLDHNKYINQHIKKHVDNYKNITIMDDDDETINDNDDDFDTMQTQKREKFYENRKRLGHNDYSSSRNDQHFDYERQNNAKRKFKSNKPADHSQSEFFDSSNSRDNNKFDETQDSTITWGK